MAKKQPKIAPRKPTGPRQISPDLQARMDRFVKAIGHLILVKVNPETARENAKPL